MKRAFILVGGLGAALLIGCQDKKSPDTMPSASVGQAPAAQPAAAKAGAAPQIFEYRDGGKTYVLGSADSLARFVQTKQPPATETLYHNGEPILVETTGGKQADLFAAYQKSHK